MDLRVWNEEARRQGVLERLARGLEVGHNRLYGKGALYEVAGAALHHEAEAFHYVFLISQKGQSLASSPAKSSLLNRGTFKPCVPRVRWLSRPECVYHVAAQLLWLYLEGLS